MSSRSLSGSTNTTMSHKMALKTSTNGSSRLRRRPQSPANSVIRRVDEVLTERLQAQRRSGQARPAQRADSFRKNLVVIIANWPLGDSEPVLTRQAPWG